MRSEGRTKAGARPRRPRPQEEGAGGGSGGSAGRGRAPRSLRPRPPHNAAAGGGGGKAGRLACLPGHRARAPPPREALPRQRHRSRDKHAGEARAGSPTAGHPSGPRDTGQCGAAGGRRQNESPHRPRGTGVGSPAPRAAGCWSTRVPDGNALRRPRHTRHRPASTAAAPEPSASRTAGGPPARTRRVSDTRSLQSPRHQLREKAARLGSGLAAD